LDVQRTTLDDGRRCKKLDEKAVSPGKRPQPVRSALSLSLSSRGKLECGFAPLDCVKQQSQHRSLLEASERQKVNLTTVGEIGLNQNTRLTSRSISSLKHLLQCVLPPAMANDNPEHFSNPLIGHAMRFERSTLSRQAHLLRRFHTSHRRSSGSLRHPAPRPAFHCYLGGFSPTRDALLDRGGVVLNRRSRPWKI